MAITPPPDSELSISTDYYAPGGIVRTDKTFMLPLDVREQVNHVVDSIVALSTQIEALDTKRQALRAELLKLCCPSS